MRVRERNEQASDEREVLPAWVSAAGSGAGAAAASATMLVVLAVLGWLTGAGGSETAWATVAAGLAGWAFAHGASLGIPGGRVDLTPWLLAAWPLLCAGWSAQRVVPDPRQTSRPLRGFGGMRRDVAVSGGAFIGGYVLTALVMAVVAHLGGARPSLLGTLAGAVVLAVLAYVWALVGAHRNRVDGIAPRVTWAWREYVPTWVARSVRPAVTALTLTAGAGLLTVVVALGLGISSVAAVYDRVGGGVVGFALLTLAQVAYLPTLAMWAASWLAGPGFTLGGGSSVTWFTSQPGVIPLVPVLAATPTPGPLPVWTPVVVLVPLLIGAGLGLACARRSDGSLGGRARVTGAAVVLYGLGILLACLAASGSVGGDRYAHVGVDVVWTTLALTGEVGAAALALAVVGGLRGRRTSAEDELEEDVTAAAVGGDAQTDEVLPERGDGSEPRR